MIDMHRNSPSKYNQNESMAIEKNDYSLNRHACSYEYQSIIAFLTNKIQQLLSSILEDITQLLNHENTIDKLTFIFKPDSVLNNAFKIRVCISYNVFLR